MYCFVKFMRVCTYVRMRVRALMRVCACVCVCAMCVRFVLSFAPFQKAYFIKH